jgi:hypothetical protein
MFSRSRSVFSKRLAALPLLSPITGVLAFLIESQPADDSREPDSYLDPLLLQATVFGPGQKQKSRR